MRIAFYGIARQVGTSANMAAVSAGLTHYLKYSVFPEPSGEKTAESAENMFLSFGTHMPPGKIILTDCQQNEKSGEIINACDLLVLNFSIPFQESDYLYFRHFSVQKNVIFLIGKYHKNQSDELKHFIRHCRIDPMRICIIPYNLRFQKAYENQKILQYLTGYAKNAGVYEALIFEKYLRRTVNTIINFGNRKGENYNG